MSIRAARPSDASRLAELRWEFRAGRDTPAEERDAFIARCAAWMTKELSAGGSWRAWIAEGEGRIVGQVWLRLIDKVPNPIGERARHAYLSNLYVTPASRGGTGTRLLEAALAHAADAGVDCVLLWPSAFSRTLYLRHGFTPHGEVLELKHP